MQISGLIDEDFINYRKPSMFIGFPHCTFKCDYEYGEQICQNSALATTPRNNITINDLVDRYLANPITSAIVCGGLEPFDSPSDLLELVTAFRERTDDDIVIYTGFTESELSSYISALQNATCNIIIKFGRFVPHQDRHYDEVLGIYLSSNNQYGKKIC